MKKFFYMMLALLMLLTAFVGCAKKVEAPAPTAIPEVEKTEEPEEEYVPVVTRKPLVLEAIQPTATPEPHTVGKLTDAEIDAIMKPYHAWAKLSEYPGAPSLRYNCSYVRMPEKGDWKKIRASKGNQGLFLEVPYNIGVPDMGDKPSQFMTNKELIEQLGEKQVRHYALMSLMYADACANNYPKDMSTEKLTSIFKDCGLPNDVAQHYAEERVNFYNQHVFTRESMIIGDELGYLAYRDAEGIIRNRIEYNTIIRDASDEFCTAVNMRLEDLQKWVTSPAEVKIFTDDNGNITDMKLVPLGDARPIRDKIAAEYEKILKK